MSANGSQRFCSRSRVCLDSVLDDFDIRLACWLCLGQWGVCGCVRDMNCIQPASIISYVVYSYGATTFYRSKLCKLAELKVVIVVQSSDIHS